MDTPVKLIKGQRIILIKEPSRGEGGFSNIVTYFQVHDEMQTLTRLYEHLDLDMSGDVPLYVWADEWIFVSDKPISDDLANHMLQHFDEYFCRNPQR